MTTKNYAREKLAEIRRNNLYRELKSISVINKMKIQVDGKRAINFCSNDYLGLSQNARVLYEAKKKLNQVSQCSSRLVSGNSPDIEMLENKLARHCNTESALVYPTGYMANLGVLSALADKDSIIYSDELNHSSIIDGCRLSGAAVNIFRHNDACNLGKLIESDNKSKRKIIITEGIFSVNGDIAKLSDICLLAKNANALFILDDAHGDFIFGRPKNYSGIADLLRVSRLIDVHVSSLSKAIGCFGGYVATSHSIRELLINKSRQLIYTSALPSHICRATLAAISEASKGNLQKKLLTNIYYFKKALGKMGFLVDETTTQIVPIITGDERTTVKISESLLKMGVFIQAIRYPTVDRGYARLRISLTAEHDRGELDFTLSCLEKTGKRYRLI
jgi:glycine C-acetyltransferase